MAIEHVAELLGMARIRVLEVATFYTMFQLAPVGRKAHVQVCGTTPCVLRGAEELFKVCKRRIHHDPFHVSADGDFSWEEVECLGACVNAPMVLIGSDTYEDLTAETFEKVALDSGALDFVDKSRSPDILARRLRLILEAGKRPLELPDDESLHIGRLTLRPNACRAYWDSRDVGLTVTEFNIVKLLAAEAGENVTYRAIYDRVHHAGFIAGSGEDGYRTNVRSSIKRIRNKFKAIDPGFSGIENFAGFGYRWESLETSAAR